MPDAATDDQGQLPPLSDWTADVTGELEQPPQPGDARPQPYGPWTTVGLTAAILLVHFAVGVALGIVLVVAWLASGGSQHDLDSAMRDQMALITGVSLLIATPIMLAITYWLVRMRGFAWRDYLNLDRPRPMPTIIGLLLVTLFVGLESLGSYLADRPVPDFMTDVMTTSSPVSLLLALVAIIVLAPLGEEILFRGFMFRGLQRRDGGSTLAVLLTAGLFAIIHVQYQAFEIATIFLFGLLLGIIRARTGSTTLCILLHAAMNTLAVAVYLLFLNT